jgi:predicted RNA-binding protein (virulence factor B family)
MKIGQYNDLLIDRFTSVGAYLVDDQKNDVLLPKKYLTTGFQLGDTINVFIYKDSEDRIVATTQKPKLKLHEFGYLSVKSVNEYGAFMDWGLEKDLLVPFSEQKEKFILNEEYLIYLLLDQSTERLIGTSKIKKHLSKEIVDLSVGNKINALICDLTGLGRKVIVNNKYHGLIFNNFLTKICIQGDIVEGYIYNIRSDGKLDISLEKMTHEKFDDHSELILQKLFENDGILNFSDNSNPDEIKLNFGMSKKSFKKAIGNLYREERISIHPTHIALNKKSL